MKVLFLQPHCFSILFQSVTGWAEKRLNPIWVSKCVHSSICNQEVLTDSFFFSERETWLKINIFHSNEQSNSKTTVQKLLPNTQMNHCPVIIQMTLKQVLSITQVPLSPLIMNYILCRMGKTRLSTTLRKIQKLRGKKKKHMRQHGVVSCKTPGNAGDYFYWKAMKSKYYHYRTSPGLFSSFHYYCTASSAIVFVNTIGRTLQPVGDSVNWDLPCEY